MLCYVMLCMCIVLSSASGICCLSIGHERVIIRRPALKRYTKLIGSTLSGYMVRCSTLSGYMVRCSTLSGYIVHPLSYSYLSNSNPFRDYNLGPLLIAGAKEVWLGFGLSRVVEL